MDKNYNQQHEKNIYADWEKSGSFFPNNSSDKTFTIIMPPPNANGNLHIGHARFVTVEDVLVRYHRMLGESTLWLPGADHAGIETQFVFEKELKLEGKSRFDYDRDTFYKMLWDFSHTNKVNMENQLRALGASCDWNRNVFTLDPRIISIVYKTFKKLSDDNLLYRGKKLVNYCTHCGTAFSNLEVDHIERKDPLYYMKYGPFTLATTRPETKFGDTAVAVHPDDERYKDYVGQTITVKGLIGDFQVKVIADKAVDPKFGTGVVKITPAHDFNDFEMGERHGLEVKQVIGLDGKLNELTGKYQGLYINQARKQIVEDMQKAGIMVKVDNDYNHTIGICYKCKNVIEPMLLDQWFLKVESLAKESLRAIKEGEVKFAAKKYEKIANHWLKNLKDWNISRQIVWGIRIPAWKCAICDKWTITAGETPTECHACHSTKLTQDTDTFDTWFSSGQWPFATLKVNGENDFKRFYPTSVMETGYDILPFWVIRMIMFGLYVNKEVPFKEVVLHGLVRDRSGQKISKSKGNVINPVEMVEKYGADAVRMSLVWGALIENDICLSEDNIKGQRNFANKIWNIARFIEMCQKDEIKKGDKKIESEMIKELDKLVKLITTKLNTFKLNEASEALYDYVWHKIADNYIEEYKKGNCSLETLTKCFETSLKLLHPFMPFVTESIWKVTHDEALITSIWPK